MLRGRIGSRLIRWIAPSMAVAVCLLPVAAAAQGSPFTQPVLTAGQGREAFSGAGFQVDQTVNWDWASPPNSTFQVHDPTHGRVLMVVVYASATAAQAGLLQARAHEQAQHPSAVATTWNGPRLITGYGESIWRGNVALVQTTQAEVGSIVSTPKRPRQLRVRRPRPRTGTATAQLRSRP